MERKPVDSSNIANVGYDQDSMVLEVEFHNGSVYQYFDVPSHVYEELVSAESVGRFFNMQVKGSFRYARI